LDHIDLLRKLVAFPTINNPAQGRRPTRECPEFLKDQLTKVGLNTAILKQKGFFSVLGTHGTGRPVTLFLAHFDVVPIGPDWDSDPFELVIHDKMGYGRGTADDKGNVVALLLTAEAIAKQKIPGTVAFAMTGDEEIGGANGATLVRKTLEKQNLFPDYLVTADGVGMQIVTRRRNTCGITISLPKAQEARQGALVKHRFTTEYVGRQSRHSAYFLPGVDRHALLSASSFLLHHSQIKVSQVTGAFLKSNVVPDWFEIDGVDFASKPKTEEHACDLNLTRLLQTLLPLSRIQFPTRLSDYGITLCPNLLYEKKERWEVYFDGRAMTTNTKAVEVAIEAVLSEKLNDIKYQTLVRMGKAFMNTPTNSNLVKTAQKVALKQGLKTLPIELGGASDTRHFCDRPIEAIDFGPIGFGIHGSNEHVVLESIPQTAQFYIQLAKTLHYQKNA
jgi:succinyl-diaminopimelate desuccinylase